MTDTTVLNDASIALLANLQSGIDDAAWDVTAQISAGEPSYRCDAVNLWVSEIRPEIGAGGCVVASEVTWTYSVGICVGTDMDETLIFSGAQSHDERLWAIWVALASACCDESLIGAQGDTVRLESLRFTSNTGTITVWTGSVTGILTPAA